LNVKRPAPDNCANCGAEIPRHARACPECGADETTGWREQSIYDGLDLPDPEPQPGEKPLRSELALGWKITGAVLIALAALALLRVL
jgi:hypothetical protein